MSILKQRNKTLFQENANKENHAYDKTNARAKSDKGVKSVTWILLPLVVLRFLNVFLVRTSFVPDEYWQSLEVAHNSVFGYGYLTWEWQYGIRSYGYPAIFAIPYYLLKVSGLDNSFSMIYTPRILQACLSAIGDWYLYKCLCKYFDQKVAKFGLFCNVSSWFWWYCSTRTIINTLETNALCIGLYYYPWQKGNRHSTNTIIYQIIAIGISVLRPTAAVVWVPLALSHIIREKKFSTLLSYLLWSFLILFSSASIDRWFYGKWVFVHWNFFTFNVLKNMGVHYGSHPWHWYLSQGVPAVLTTHSVFFIHGILLILKRKVRVNETICKSLLGMCIFTLLIYSCLGHKEFRFILQLIPIASLFCGLSLSKLSVKLQIYAMIFLLITNIPTALYTGLIHQSGTLSITEKLQNSVTDKCGYDVSDSCGNVLFLTPCHSTPLYSHLHINFSIRFLTCYPNLSNEENYIDEADVFFKNPTQWLESNKVITDHTNWIVLFDSLFEQLKSYKAFGNFEICETSFHTHVPEGRVGRYVHILCRKQLT